MAVVNFEMGGLEAMTINGNIDIGHAHTHNHVTKMYWKLKVPPENVSK